MKLFFFGCTCACAGMFAGAISHEPGIGFFAALSAWWVQLSLDAIVNGIPKEPDAAPSVPGNCETEL